MPTFRVTIHATAKIEETWLIAAVDQETARRMAYDGKLQGHNLVDGRVLGTTGACPAMTVETYSLDPEANDEKGRLLTAARAWIGQLVDVMGIDPTDTVFSAKVVKKDGSSGVVTTVRLAQTLAAIDAVLGAG